MTTTRHTVRHRILTDDQGDKYPFWAVDRPDGTPARLRRTIGRIDPVTTGGTLALFDTPEAAADFGRLADITDTCGSTYWGATCLLPSGHSGLHRGRRDNESEDLDQLWSNGDVEREQQQK